MNHVWSAGKPAVVSGNTQCQILFHLVVHDEVIANTWGDILITVFSNIASPSKPNCA